MTVASNARAAAVAMKFAAESVAARGFIVPRPGRQAVAPVIYELDEEGYNRMPPREVDPGEEALARRGARACPERAITIVDEAD